MPGKKIFLLLPIVTSIIAALFTAGPLSFPAMGGEIKAKPILVYNKTNPKPTYWEWGKKYWPTKPVRGGIFRRAALKYVGVLNPNHWPINDWSVISSIYEGITNTDGSYRMAKNPWLCESFEYPAPNIVDMHLEKGVTYHDGTPFNAYSLKYMADWQRDKRNGCWTRGMMRRFKKIEVIDEYTLRWYTKDPWLSLPSGFMSFAISARALKTDVAIRDARKAVSRAKRLKRKAERSGKQEDLKAAAEAEEKARLLTEKVKGKKTTDLQPVGTGQWMFEEGRPGNYIKLKRNPNWWFGRKIGRPEMPYFDGMVIVVIPDPSIQLANLRAGKIDTIGVSKEMVATLRKDPNFNVYISPLYHTQMLGFNQSRKPCKDIRVRKAISHAIDRKALIHGTQFGLGRIASCVFPENHWAHNPGLKPVKYDPELSGKLLAEAGYANGLTLKGYTGSTPAAVTLTEAVKAMLAKVGINWQVDVLDTPAAQDRMKNLDYDMAYMPIGYIQDPDGVPTFFYFSTGAYNYGRNNNKKAISYFIKGRQATSESERKKYYAEVEKALYEDYTDVWLWWEVGAVAFRKVVQGFNHEMYLKDLNAYTVSHPLWFKDGHR